MNLNTVLIYGVHAATSIMSRQPERVIQLYVLKERQDQKIQSLMDLAKEHRIPVTLSSREALDRMTGDEVHQGVVLSCQKAKAYNENDLDRMLTQNKKPFFLILDGIQDPHNLGACLRSADAAGVHAVIAPKDKSVGLTPTASKVACGAAEVVPFVQVTNLARTMRYLKDHGVWLFGAAGEAKQTLYQADLNLPLALVLGAEGQGMRKLTREHCDVLLQIPMQGSVSSLNVSVATGIFLFEAVRQQMVASK